MVIKRRASIAVLLHRGVKRFSQKAQLIPIEENGSYEGSYLGSNSNFGHTDFKAWSSLQACHSEGATYRNHCSLMVEKKMFFQ
jgi:hypothetical protein